MKTLTQSIALVFSMLFCFSAISEHETYKDGSTVYWTYKDGSTIHWGEHLQQNEIPGVVLNQNTHGNLMGDGAFNVETYVVIDPLTGEQKWPISIYDLTGKIWSLMGDGASPSYIVIDPLTGEMKWPISIYDLTGKIWSLNENCIYWNNNQERMPINSPCEEWGFYEEAEPSVEGFFLELTHYDTIFDSSEGLLTKQIMSRIPAFKLSTDYHTTTHVPSFHQPQKQDWMCFSALYNKEGEARPPEALSFVYLNYTKIHKSSNKDSLSNIYFGDGGYIIASDGSKWDEYDGWILGGFDSLNEQESLFVYDIEGRMIELQVTKTPPQLSPYIVPGIGDNMFLPFNNEDEKHKNIKATCVSLTGLAGKVYARIMP